MIDFSANYSPARCWQGRGSLEKLVAERSVFSAFATQSFVIPDSMAIMMWENGAVEYKLSYFELMSKVSALALIMRDITGVTHHDRVAVIAMNSPETVAAHFAIMAIGAITVPIDPRESPRLIKHILLNTQVSLALIGRGLDSGTKKAIGQTRQINIYDLPNKDGSSFHHEEHSSDWPAVILHTSGTTALPKGVCLSHYNLLVNAEALRRTHELCPSHRHVGPLPLHHANGFGFAMVTTLTSGGTLILSNEFPGIDSTHMLQSTSAELISVVPEMIRLINLRPWSRERLPHLKYVVCAAAPLASRLAKSFYTNTGIRIRQGYGLSECTNFATMMPIDLDQSTYDLMMHEESVPSIGCSLFGSDVVVLNEDGTLSKEGQIGNLGIRGHHLLMGYWDDISATEHALGKGYLDTGDLGFYKQFRDRRFFFVSGREKEIIIRCGENISPIAVEHELFTLLNSSPIVALGFSNLHVGEEIGLYIEKLGDESEIQNVISALLKCPLKLRPRAVIMSNSAIPRTATGKIKRQLLAKCFNVFKDELLDRLSTPSVLTIRNVAKIWKTSEIN